MLQTSEVIERALNVCKTKASWSGGEALWLYRNGRAGFFLKFHTVDSTIYLHMRSPEENKTIMPVYKLKTELDPVRFSWIPVASTEQLISDLNSLCPEFDYVASFLSYRRKQ
jgi:hypothetical protein